MEVEVFGPGYDVGERNPGSSDVGDAVSEIQKREACDFGQTPASAATVRRRGGHTNLRLGSAVESRIGVPRA